MSPNGCARAVSWLLTQAERSTADAFWEADVYPYLTRIWIKNLRKFMAQHSFQIELTNQRTLSLKCHHDRFIMNAFARVRGESALKGFHLNCCRLFLQVRTLGDMIATVDIRLERFLRQKIIHRKSNQDGQICRSQLHNKRLTGRQHLVSTASSSTESLALKQAAIGYLDNTSPDKGLKIPLLHQKI